MSEVARRRFWTRHRAWRAEEVDMWAAFREAYPPGSAVGWERGGRHQTGHVLRHGYSGDLWVKNDHTYREVKLAATDLTDGQKPNI